MKADRFPTLGDTFDLPGSIEPFVAHALDGIAREYPNHLVHLLRDADDVRSPHTLTPMFFGSFDWHSAVHGHWCLARLMRCFPAAGSPPWVRASRLRGWPERSATSLHPGVRGSNAPTGSHGCCS